MKTSLNLTAIALSAALISPLSQAQIQAPIIKELPLISDLPVGVIAKIPGTENIALLGTLAEVLSLKVLDDPASLPGLLELDAMGELPGLDALPLP